MPCFAISSLNQSLNDLPRGTGEIGLVLPGPGSLTVQSIGFLGSGGGSGGVTNTSTLRLSALPSAVLLSALGADAPGLDSTRIAIRLLRISSLSRPSSASFTACARLLPRSRLYFSGPVLSV